MNKILAWLPALMVLVGTLAMPVKEATETHLVNKNISFSVYKSSDYTSSAYNTTSAQVHITIEKISANGQHTIVWDRTYDPKSLAAYPFLEDALKQNVTITNVNQKKEYLIVHYTLDYNAKGSEILMHEATVVKDGDSANVAISI
jgi:hypothetical protein